MVFGSKFVDWREQFAASWTMDAAKAFPFLVVGLNRRKDGVLRSEARFGPVRATNWAVDKCDARPHVEQAGTFGFVVHSSAK